MAQSELLFGHELGNLVACRPYYSWFGGVQVRASQGRRGRDTGSYLDRGEREVRAWASRNASNRGDRLLGPSLPDDRSLRLSVCRRGLRSGDGSAEADSGAGNARAGLPGPLIDRGVTGNHVHRAAVLEGEEVRRVASLEEAGCGLTNHAQNSLQTSDRSRVRRDSASLSG